MTEAAGGMMGKSGAVRGRGVGVVDLLAVGLEVREVGGKAAPLARASAAGFRVPPGVVVTSEASVSAESLSEWLAALGPGPFAVRSSAVDEDAASRSFAGQLETLLSVGAQDVPRAIERCRASARAMRVLRYAGSPGAVAVIVQRMVPADVAGVAFSADPRTGERDVVVIEAVKGLADRLVGGEVSPEAWRCVGERAERVRSADAPVLEAPMAKRVAEMARKLEALFGGPQDVEWAVSGGELQLLQSRPITALPAAPIPIPVEPPEGDWERDDHHAVLSPLGWTWLAPYAVAMAKEMGLIMPIKEMRTKNVGGHLYTQMVMDGGGGGAPPPWWVLWLVSRIIPSLRRANHACAEMLDRETFMQALDAWDSEGRRSLAAETDALFVADPRALSDDALLAKIAEALAHTGKGLALHASLHGVGFFALGKLMMFLVDELGWDPNRTFEIVSGSSAKTTELHRSIEAALSEVDRELGGAAFPHTWGELFDRAPATAARLADWLETNRLRMMHYDPKHPMLGERPDVVLTIAQSIVESRRAHEEPHVADHAADLAEARAKLGAEKYAELERLLVNARRGYALRDDNGIETVSRPAGLLRWLVLELGRRLPLEAPEHAVYLTVEEHGPALRGEIPDLRARVEKRRGEESWAMRNRGPKLYGKPPPPMPPLDAFPSGLSRAMRVFGWIMAAEQIPEPTAGEGPLRGLGIGTRVVTARARVVERPEELRTLRHGEVLVCRITSPEWSVALGRVAAIVTDEGGLLSHPAIIAREHGVTAVLGAGLATRRIATGDTVRVDPVDGTVTLVR